MRRLEGKTWATTAGCATALGLLMAVVALDHLKLMDRTSETATMKAANAVRALIDVARELTFMQFRGVYIPRSVRNIWQLGCALEAIAIYVIAFSLAFRWTYVAAAWVRGKLSRRRRAAPSGHSVGTPPLV